MPEASETKPYWVLVRTKPTIKVNDMTGKERVLAALRCNSVDRVPWVPFVGCHAGALIGASATEVLSSADTMVKGIDAAIERYGPDGIPITFDLQIEAEALGCELVWADENPPSVATHPLELGAELSSLSVPAADTGRLAMALEATRRIRQCHEDIALYGLVTGPFTLALHLYGTGLFMSMFDDPDFIEDLMAFCADVTSTTATHYWEAGCDVIAVVDPMTSQIGPDQFRQFVTPHMSRVFSHIHEEGGLASFFVCGNAQQNVEAMCECGPDNVSVDENIPLDFVRDICLPRGVSFGGNLQLTSVLLLGTPEEAQRNAIECMEIGGEKGFILAPGCDLPYATPPANLEAVTQIVVDDYQREVAKARTNDATIEDRLDMSEYGQTDKVIVDIITLDSEACAPCQYMVESVKAVAPEFEGIVEWREHKIKTRESLVFMTSLMVRNIPTICIDGRIVFTSQIPPRDELVSAIQKRINEKLRIKIRSRRASLIVLGSKEDEATQQATQIAQTAIKELGADVDLVHISDEKRIREYGFLPGQTPAIVLARYQTKSTGTVPPAIAVREWIKDIT